MAGLSTGLVAWKTLFQLSPIILVDGLAQGLGGLLPLAAISQSIDFLTGALAGRGVSPELDDFFLNFEPMPGATLINQRIGHYPFANAAVAANSVIVDPNVLSMRMIAVASQRFGYFEKLAVMTAITAALRAHNVAGGTYLVATPAYIFTNCVMLAMRDISTNATHQPQNTWQLDFEQPLLTVNQAAGALGGLFNQITNGTPIPGNPSTLAWSGASTGGTVPGVAGIPASPAGPAGGGGA